MPFKSDKQRRYLWSQKPEVAKQIAYKNKGGPLSYEDPILLNELKKKMEERVAKAKEEGINVTHDYLSPAQYKKIYGEETFEANPGSLGRWNAETSWRPVPGMKNIYDIKRQNINVPMTPSLSNAHTVGEEYAHAKQAGKLDGVHKNKIMKSTRKKPSYAEEMRAKKAADEFIGGYHTPLSGEWVDYTRDGYRKHYVPHMGARNVLRAEAEAQGVLDEASYRNEGGGLFDFWHKPGNNDTVKYNRQFAEYMRERNAGNTTAKFKDWRDQGGGSTITGATPSFGESVKDVARVATPYGSLEDAYSAGQNIAAGNYGAAAGDAAMAAAGFLPFVRPAARTIKAAPLAKAALQGGDDAVEYAKLFGREVAGLPDRPARSVGASANWHQAPGTAGKLNPKRQTPEKIAQYMKRTGLADTPQNRKLANAMMHDAARIADNPTLDPGSKVYRDQWLARGADARGNPTLPGDIVDYANPSKSDIDKYFPGADMPKDTYHVVGNARKNLGERGVFGQKRPMTMMDQDIGIRIGDKSKGNKPTYIKEHLAKPGVVPVNPNPAPLAATKTIDEIDAAAALADKQAGMTAAELAEKYGISKSQAKKLGR